LQQAKERNSISVINVWFIAIILSPNDNVRTNNFS